MQSCIAVVVAMSVSMLAGAAWADDIAPNDVEFADAAVSVSLTGKPGDAAEGAKVFVDRKLGNCLACHLVRGVHSRQNVIDVLQRYNRIFGSH